MPVQNAVAKEAICNDGSPAKFYARPGTKADGDKWIVHLQGGGSCSSEAECKERSRKLMTSRGLGAARSPGGILSANPRANPDFHGYTHVYVPYCSSDSWMGDNSADNNALGMHWRGKKIVAAVIDDLKQHGLADADQMLFTGCSAGAAGMRHNLDDVSAMLPGVDVKGVSDAAYTPRIDNISTERAELFASYKQRKLALWNPSPDASCSAAEGRESCLGGAYVAETYVTTPLFVRMAQRDHMPLKRYDLTPRDPQAQLFAGEVRKVMDRRDSGFSPNTSKHCTITGADFNRERVAGVSFRDTVGNWVNGRGGPVKVIER